MAVARLESDSGELGRIKEVLEVKNKQQVAEIDSAQDLVRDQIVKNGARAQEEKGTI